MQPGWVYVLVNGTFPDLVKVGQTTRLCSTRAAELSHASGVPTPFIPVFEQPFADCIKAERDIHSWLDKCHLRHAANREFFRGSVNEIIRLILQYATETGDATPQLQRDSAPTLLALGDRHMLGEGDTFQDTSEALRYYQMAAIRGSVVACERLGAIISHTHAAARSGRTRALGYLKEGIRRGNYYCYCEIGCMAAEENHPANFIKAWNRFFVQRQAAFLDEAEIGDDRYPKALQRYVVTCFKLGIMPSHVPEIMAEAAAVIALLHQALKTAHDMPDRKRNLLIALRWAHIRPITRSTWNWLPRWPSITRDVHA
jgi:hypothetical protein